MSSVIIAGDTSGSVTVSAPAVSGTSVLTLPVATDTLIGKATTDTLTNKSIAVTQLTGTLAVANGGTGTTSTTFVNLATNVTGTLPVANGGTGVTTKTGTGAVVLGTSPTLTTPTFDSASLATVSGTAPLYMCRAWVNFNGTGTVAIRASGNVSSITDNGTGNYTVSFTTAMSDANYCALATSGNSSSNVSGIVNSSNRSAGGCQIYPTVGSVDAASVDMAIFR